MLQALVEIGILGGGGLIVVIGAAAGQRGARAVLDRGQVIGVERAVIAGIAELAAAIAVEDFVRVAAGAARIVAVGLVAADELSIVSPELKARN
jgi:hypothetical protein